MLQLRWENIVLPILAFIILLLLLKKYALQSLFEVLEKRRTFVKRQLAEAAHSRSEAQAYIEEQKQVLAVARKEAYEMVEQAKQMSTRQADELISNAKCEVARLKEAVARDIANEKNKAIIALHEEVSHLSVAIASKILEKKVDATEQKQLIDRYLKKVGGI